MFEAKITKIEILKIKNLFAKLRMDFTTIESVFDLSLKNMAPSSHVEQSKKKNTSKSKLEVAKSVHGSASGKRNKKQAGEVMKRTMSEKFNCRANLANKHIQNRKSFNKKTPRIIAPVTNLNIMNPMNKNFNVKSTSKIKFHHGTIITDYLMDEQKQKLFNISSMIKNSKSFDKEVRPSHSKNSDLNKYSSSVKKKTSKVYKTLNNEVFEIDRAVQYKPKSKAYKEMSGFKLGSSYIIPASSKQNNNLNQNPIKYFGSFKLTNLSDKDGRTFNKTADPHCKIKNKRHSKSSSKTQHSRSNTEYLKTGDMDDEILITTGKNVPKTDDGVSKSKGELFYDR